MNTVPVENRVHVPHGTVWTGTKANENLREPNEKNELCVCSCIGDWAMHAALLFICYNR